MYRESLLGTALAITLQEIAPQLNAGQKARLWQLFDETMKETLQEVPVMTRVEISVPPPISLDSPPSKLKDLAVPSAIPLLVTPPSTGRTERAASDVPSTVSALDPLAHRDPASASSSSSSPALQELSTILNDSQLTFPIYRKVDGMWTLLLKDPEVLVRDEFGKSEKLKLDYLKVYLQECAPSLEGDSGPQNGKGRRGRKRGRQ